MKFVLRSHFKAFSLAPDQIRMRHSPQTRRFAIFNSERSSLSFYMIPEWSLIPEREFHRDWTQWFWNDLYVNKMSFRYHVNKYREICGDGMNPFQNYQGSYRFLDPKFKTFSKTIIFLPDSEGHVIKKVINRDLKKRRNKAFTTMRCNRTGEIEYDLTNTKKISLVKHLLSL